MRIITLNANGIRAAARKGFYQWLPRQKADVVCIQETKAQVHQLEDRCFFPRRWHVFYEDAQRKGYSGTAMYSRREPDEIIRGFGVPEFDDEGRYLEARFGRLSVISLYAPSGSSNEDRQASKFRFMDAFMPYLRALREADRDYVICGDWNIAHKKIDLKNWRSNQKNSGFLPEERAWMDELFDRRFLRCVSRDQPVAGPVHLVVEPWPGLGQERRLAHRLPGDVRQSRRQRAKREDLQEQTLLRPRAADHGL